MFVKKTTTTKNEKKRKLFFVFKKKRSEPIFEVVLVSLSSWNKTMTAKCRFPWIFDVVTLFFGRKQVVIWCKTRFDEQKEKKNANFKS